MSVATHLAAAVNRRVTPARWVSRRPAAGIAPGGPRRFQVGQPLEQEAGERRTDIIGRDAAGQATRAIVALTFAAVFAACGPQQQARTQAPPAAAAEDIGAVKDAFDTTHRLLRWASTFDNALLLLAMVVYLAVRLIKLTDFPIWFFADEAIQTILASDFVRDGLRDFHGHLFPTYFLNVYGYNENLTVYVQVIPYLLFGKSVFVTRAVSVLVTAFGALAVGLTLRHVFRIRLPWAGILLLSAPRPGTSIPAPPSKPRTWPPTTRGSSTATCATAAGRRAPCTPRWSSPRRPSTRPARARSSSPAAG